MEASVDPEFYFNVYSPVSSLVSYNVLNANSEIKQRNILIGTCDGKVLNWDLKSRKQLCDIEYNTNLSKKPILWLCIVQTHNELLLFIQERFSNEIHILKHEDNTWCISKRLQLREKHVGFCKGDHLLNSLLVCPSGENSFDVIKIAESKANSEFKIVSPSENFKSCGTISSLKFCIIEKRQALISLFENGDLYLFQVNINNENLTIELFFKYPSLLMSPLSLAFDNDNLRGIVVGSEDNITSFELTVAHDKIDLHQLKKRQISTKGLSSVIIRPDKKIAVIGSWDSTIKLFSWLHPEKLKPLGALKFHSECVEVVTTISDTKLIAAGSKDGRISFWNIY